jgi:hypothetical protein
MGSLPADSQASSEGAHLTRSYVIWVISRASQKKIEIGHSPV